MAFINRLSKNLANIDVYLDRYEKFIEDNKEFFNTDNVKLEVLCKKLPKLTCDFKLIASELKSMNDYLEFRKETLEGELWKKYIEGSKRHMAPKDIQMYTKQDESFVFIGENILEIAHMKRNVDACIEALETLHWQLNNIVKIRVAELEEAVL